MKLKLSIFCFCMMLAALAAMILRAPTQSGVLVSTAADAKTDITSLPPGSIVLTLKDGAQITPPFRLGEDPKAVGGVALLLPKGQGTKEHTGIVKLSANAPEAGSYKAWARVLWRDECGNSINLKVGDAPTKLVGEDSLFGAWHWVPAGEYKLAKGENPFALLERENGIALDEMLFTPSNPTKEYTPIGMISTQGEMRGIRRFADDFSRSPGHGMEGWDLVSGKWDIAFSFDPNRIPNQYALNGVCGPCAEPVDPSKPAPPTVLGGSGTGMALVKAAPWYGCRMDFSFYPAEEGKYGAVLDRSSDGKEALLVSFSLADKRAEVLAEGSGIHTSAELGDAVRLKQWHHVVIERWAWILRVYVDDKLVLSNFEASPRAGAAGFFVASGKATFDDLELEEIAWQADNNADQNISWQSPAGAKWFRSEDSQTKQKKLIGQTGVLTTKLGELPLEEVILEEIAQPKGKVQLNADGMSSESKDGVTILKRDYHEKAAAGKTLSLNVSGEEAQLKRVAIRYGERAHPKYVIGPYNFAESEIEDPSDYLDFTPEEYKKMQESADAQKLKRQAKFKPLVGDGMMAESPWVRERGAWYVNNGVLSANAPALVRHAEEATSDVDVHLKIRLNDPTAFAEIELYATPDPGVRIQILGEKATVKPQWANAHVQVKTTASQEFHELSIHAEGNHVSVKFDKEPIREADFKKGDGGRLLLKVPAGRADFDDILCEYPKRTPHGAIYSFQHRENDWWRDGKEGTWIDHGGISCVLASSWVSLVSPNGEGMLWNKRPIKPDALIAFDVEENTEWFGWDRYPSHVHYPYDNIRAEFAGAAGAYRLVVNAEEHTATILYRNGVEVARVRQDGNFPMRFYGGHAPFMPRRSRITLVKRGDVIRGIVNGREVLNFKDPAPVEVNKAGIGGNNTHINFSHIEVRDIEAEPVKAEPAPVKAEDPKKPG